MSLLLISSLFMIFGAFATLILKKNVAVPTLIIGCLVSLIPTLDFLFTGKSESFTLISNAYYGNFIFNIDALTSFFLLPILVISIITSIYGLEYMKKYKNTSSLWFFFNLLVVSMIGVVTSRNGILFLICWEIMSLSSFFLVSFENEKKDVRRASLIYLVAMHIGTAFLLIFFALCWINTGSLDFESFKNLSTLSSQYIDILFVLAVIGFGTKAGFIVLHVWLPEAHPSAPSHVSSIMSGVMIKTGIYGIIRVLMLLGETHIWWGYLLITIGIFSGIIGVLFALAQHDLKRLLAYHSVENIGIITLGIGMGVIGLCCSSPIITIMGFGGGLLHIINHALFKGLLFLGAGSVLHATETRDIEKLGGLLKFMPITGTTFLIGSVAISGLPPLNGFMSEFLIYISGFNGIFLRDKTNLIFSIGVIISLAIIGVLASACFAKAFGVVFLGEKRSKNNTPIHEAGFFMSFSMIVLTLGCIFMGLFAPVAFNLTTFVIKDISGYPIKVINENFLSISELLWNFVFISIIFLVIALIIFGISIYLRKKRIVNMTETWGCGYNSATPKMQYTASSFARPILNMFRIIIREEKEIISVKGLFPESAFMKAHTPDLFYDFLLKPSLSFIEKIFSKFKWIQHGNLELYILYITVTLLILLIWKVS